MISVEADRKWAVQEISGPTKGKDSLAWVFDVTLGSGGEIARGQVEVPYGDIDWFKKARGSSQTEFVREFLEGRLRESGNVQDGWRQVLSRDSHSF